MKHFAPGASATRLRRRQRPTFAQALGLSYRVRASNDYHPFYIQNLKFLQDFWTHPLRLVAQAQAQVLEALRVYPGVSVAALLDAHPELAVDVIWAMLTSQHIFTTHFITKIPPME